MCLPPTNMKDEILDHLSKNTEIHFKNQQQGEPELTVSEKKNIAETILNKSITLFLSRFGQSLTYEQVEYFKDAPDEDQYIVKYYLDMHKNTRSKVNDKRVKNRRYEAMKQLMAEGSYFSESEMKSRNPLLYDQLVGQYMTPDEKEYANRIDTSNMTFVNVLLQQIDRDNEEMFKQEQLDNESSKETTSSDNVLTESSYEMQTEKTTSEKSTISYHEQFSVKNEVECDSSDEDDEEEEEESSMPCRLNTNSPLINKINVENQTPKISLWGEEMIDEPLSKPVGQDRTPWATASSSQAATIPKYNQISEKEKSLLFEEFRTQMFTDFLEGKEKEFDYSEVDNNAAYDDLTNKSLEAEEKYFDEDEEENSCSEMQVDPPSEKISSESEDELDRFMNNLKPELMYQELNSQMKHL